MSYVTKADVQNYSGIAISATLNTFITELITTAEEWVEEYCGNKRDTGIRKRWFDDDNTDKTFYYNGNGSTNLRIDDLRVITSLTVDFGLSSSTLLVEGTDFYAYPLNAIAYGEPYTEIQLIQPSTRLNLNSRIANSAPYIFDEGQKTVQIVGKFGYSTTPPEAVKKAVIKIVVAMIKENMGDTDLKELKSESIGDYAATFVEVSKIADRMGVANLLEKYKRTINVDGKESKGCARLLQI